MCPLCLFLSQLLSPGPTPALFPLYFSQNQHFLLRTQELLLGLRNPIGAEQHITQNKHEGARNLSLAVISLLRVPRDDFTAFHSAQILIFCLTMELAQTHVERRMWRHGRAQETKVDSRGAGA